MINTLKAEDWKWHKPNSKKAEVKFEITDETTHVHFAVRSMNPVTLSAITKDGQTLFIDWGQSLSFNMKTVGFAALEIVADGPFAYQISEKLKWFEKPDPNRLVVPIEDPADKGLRDLMAQEHQKLLAQLEYHQLLTDDVSAQELYDDYVNGDLEFEEEEPDPFGLGYQERMEAWSNERDAGLPQDDEGPQEEAEGDGPSSAAPGKRSAGPKGRQEDPKGSAAGSDE